MPRSIGAYATRPPEFFQLPTRKRYETVNQIYLLEFSPIHFLHPYAYIYTYIYDIGQRGGKFEEA